MRRRDKLQASTQKITMRRWVQNMNRKKPVWFEQTDQGKQKLADKEPKQRGWKTGNKTASEKTEREKRFFLACWFVMDVTEGLSHLQTQHIWWSVGVCAQRSNRPICLGPLGRCSCFKESGKQIISLSKHKIASYWTDKLLVTLGCSLYDGRKCLAERMKQ